MSYVPPHKRAGAEKLTGDKLPAKDWRDRPRGYRGPWIAFESNKKLNAISSHTFGLEKRVGDAHQQEDETEEQRGYEDD